MAKDKESRREERAAERQDIESIKASMHMNIDDTLMHIAASRSGVTLDKSGGNGGSNLIDKRADQQYLAGKKMAQEHINWDSVLARTGYQPQNRPSNPGVNTISIALNNRALESFQPVVSELNKFKFASTPDKRDEQMDQIVAAVKEALQKVAIKEVAANTKRFYDNAVKFAQTGVGMKVTYKVASASVVVTAAGDFYGDEIVCLEQDGANATAYVARQVGSEFEDITGRFSVKLELAK